MQITEKTEAASALELKPLRGGKRPAAPIPARASDKQSGVGGRFVKDTIVGNFDKHFTYEEIPTDRLLIDQRYQRPFKPMWASVLAHNWNEDKTLPFVVSLRDNGNYYVLDGQQRHGALQMMENPPETVYAKVFRNLSLKEEADLFYSLGTDHFNLTTGAKFKAALVGEQPWAISLYRAANEAGYKEIKSYPGVNNLTAISKAREILERRGEFLITRILKITRTAWPESENSARSDILQGLEAFFIRYPTANDQRVTQQLRLNFDSPRDLEHTAHGYAKTLRKSIGPAMGYTIYDFYNKLLRTNRLSDWVW
jgi:hypothetical protein